MFSRAVSRALMALAVISPVVVLVAPPAMAAVEQTFTTGIFEPGESETFSSVVASDTAVYQAGLGPLGTSGNCSFDITRTWYSQTVTGARTFHVTVVNSGVEPCATVVSIGSVERFRNWTTGTLNPGAWKAWTWNNANPLSSIYLAGVTPAGTTQPFARCQLEVQRVRTVKQPGGEREFAFRVRNVGAIACGGDVGLARLPRTENPSAFTLDVAPGVEVELRVSALSSDPALVSVFGLSPEPVDGDNPCVVETEYWRYIHIPSRRPDRYIGVVVKNVGNTACTLNQLWAAA